MGRMVVVEVSLLALEPLAVASAVGQEEEIALEICLSKKKEAEWSDIDQTSHVGRLERQKNWQMKDIMSHISQNNHQDMRTETAKLLNANSCYKRMATHCYCWYSFQENSDL